MQRNKFFLWITTPILLAVFASASPAAVLLRYSPDDQSIPMGGNGSLSIMLDDAIDVRTVEVRVQYDADILMSLGGNPGFLFVETGCQLFPAFDDSTPGEWYGAVAILGVDCWITEPGELYSWDFQGIGNGYSGINTVEVRLYDPGASLIDSVTLAPTHVFVGDGTDVPVSAASALSLGIHPNPFNPETRLSFSGPAGAARLAVYDLTGRELGVLWSGELGGEGNLSARWSGLDAAGETQASGVYFFRLETESGERVTKRAVMLK